MLSGIVLTYDESLNGTNFKQTSINLDACFILSYLDTTDFRGERVDRMLELWKEHSIIKIGISNHVFGEVVHQLFRSYILESITMIYRRDILKRKLDPDQTGSILNEEVAREFLNMCDKEQLKRLERGHFSGINVGKLVKEIKNMGEIRKGLDVYYNIALDKYSEFEQLLVSDMDFKIEHITSDNNTRDIANSIMRTSQLEILDSLHIALTVQHNYDFFATMDEDFVHNYYDTGPLGNVRILKIA